MCGIAGSIERNVEAQILESSGRAMMGRLTHRGPDDQGLWLDASVGVMLGHTRLSIVDLSQAGHQPMVSSTGRFVTVFNGEIYNHLSLRQQLERDGLTPQWRGHSDTEIMLAAFEAWGIRATVEKIVGMFAFALWDRNSRTLTLARDRLGEKPLYYGWQGDTLLFASEVKSLRAHPTFRACIDRGALSLLLRYNCIPAPYSIYKGVAKLTPGTLLTVSPGQRDSRPEPYWSVRGAVESGLASRFVGSARDAVDALDTLLRDAIAGQMMADVPLGAFLSGGVDSSTVVALMQAQASRPVKTFSIGFHESDYNEAKCAKAVARHLGTQHTELYVTPMQALEVIPKLPSLYCEPFADSSQIPTFLVAQLARQHVAVSLSGDAGDELFCGYNRYAFSAQLWKWLRLVPVAARNRIAKGLIGISPAMWNAALRPALAAISPRRRPANIGDKVHKAARALTSQSSAALYRDLVSHWDEPEAIVVGGAEPPTLLTSIEHQPRVENDVERMMALDLSTYLPDDVLTKVDRAAMGVSLETRVPYLDHRVVEFAWRIPLEMKINDGQTKWLLRQVLYRYVPKELVERPKMGFGVPIDSWLRGPLRDWAENLLDESRLKREGFFHAAPIRQKWREHLSEQRNWQHHLWDVLMFQAWIEAQGFSSSSPTMARLPSGTLGN